jgi:hypothetical protein
LTRTVYNGRGIVSATITATTASDYGANTAFDFRLSASRQRWISAATDVGAAAVYSMDCYLPSLRRFVIAFRHVTRLIPLYAIEYSPIYTANWHGTPLVEDWTTCRVRSGTRFNLRYEKNWQSRCCQQLWCDLHGGCNVCVCVTKFVMVRTLSLFLFLC